MKPPEITINYYALDFADGSVKYGAKKEDNHDNDRRSWILRSLEEVASGVRRFYYDPNIVKLLNKPPNVIITVPWGSKDFTPRPLNPDEEERFLKVLKGNS
ncbi:MAG: hypothetical protein WC796_06375 [Candidatus Pacearchaeota archaeon]|jgi:hypothetical protein